MCHHVFHFGRGRGDEKIDKIRTASLDLGLDKTLALLRLKISHSAKFKGDEVCANVTGFESLSPVPL